MLAACTLIPGFLASYWSAGFGTFLLVSALASHWLEDYANFNREKYTFSVIKSLDLLKNLKNGPVLYLGLKPPPFMPSKAKSIS
jgi:hypothetical protein